MTTPTKFAPPPSTPNRLVSQLGASAAGGVRSFPKPLKRPAKPRSPLKRYVRPKAKRATPRRAPYRTSDPAREAWCRGQLLCVNSFAMLGRRTPCYGPMEASHMGPRATAVVVPQCHQHHVVEWHTASGFCKGWGREQRRAFAAHVSVLATIRYEAGR